MRNNKLSNGKETDKNDVMIQNYIMWRQWVNGFIIIWASVKREIPVTKSDWLKQLDVIWRLWKNFLEEKKFTNFNMSFKELDKIQIERSWWFEQNFMPWVRNDNIRWGYKVSPMLGFRVLILCDQNKYEVVEIRNL